MPETLTYREIGERLGISPDAARMKAKRMAKRGLWRILPQNHPADTVHVEVPDEHLVMMPRPERPPPPDPPDDIARSLITALRDAQGRVNTLTEMLMAEKDARRRDAAELAAAEARELGTAAELRRALADLAAAKMRLRRRPWWKRIFS